MISICLGVGPFSKFSISLSQSPRLKGFGHLSVTRYRAECPLLTCSFGSSAILRSVHERSRFWPIRPQARKYELRSKAVLSGRSCTTVERIGRLPDLHRFTANIEGRLEGLPCTPSGSAKRRGGSVRACAPIRAVARLAGPPMDCAQADAPAFLTQSFCPARQRLRSGTVRPPAELLG